MDVLPIQDQLECLFCYLILIGLLYFIVFMLGTIVAAVVSPRTRSAYYSKIGRLGIFLITLLLVGAPASILWSATIWGRFYYSTDYCGIDLLPFVPITQGLIDAPFGNERGRLIGVSLLQLNLIWAIFAIFIWSSTIYLYRKVVAIGRKKVTT